MAMSITSGDAIAFFTGKPTGIVNVEDSLGDYYSLRYTFPAGVATPTLLDATGRVPDDGDLPAEVINWRDTITAGL